MDKLIDIDPHFKRVVRYFRPEDYWTWTKFSVGVPLFFAGMSSPPDDKDRC